MNKKELEKKITQQQKELQKDKEQLETLKTMRDYSGNDEVITSEEAKELLENKEDRIIHKSDIPTLDKLLEGFEGGDLVVISGPTKEGKTSLGQTLTTNFSKKDIISLWFSYELRRRSFLDSFGEETPFFVLPKELKTSSMDWIEQKVVEAKAKYDMKMVFIDHLHYLMSLEKAAKSNTSLLIGGLMRELKKMAVRWDVTIFLIAHTRKIEFDNEPDLADIRDSSFISQEADTTLIMWRVEEQNDDGEVVKTNYAKLKVAANRRTGKTGIVPLVYEDNHFDEYTDHYNES